GHGYADHAGPASAEEPVDVGQLQPGVGEHAGGVFGVDLGHRPVRDDAIRVLVRTDDVRLAFDAHAAPIGIFTSISVNARTSSAEKPSATSSMTNSPSMRRKIARSVTTTSTHATPVNGYAVLRTNF